MIAEWPHRVVDPPAEMGKISRDKQETRGKQKSDG
jgi:hypothetical protein